jgi:hypothetical protein
MTLYGCIMAIKTYFLHFFVYFRIVLNSSIKILPMLSSWSVAENRASRLANLLFWLRERRSLLKQQQTHAKAGQSYKITILCVYNLKFCFQFLITYNLN